MAANQQSVIAPCSIYRAQNFAIAQEKETVNVVREVPQEEQSGVEEEEDDDDDDDN